VSVLTPVEGKCNAPSRGGELCRQRAGWGTNHTGVGPCKVHGGSFPTVESKYLAVVQERELTQRLAQFALPIRDADPEQTLLDLVSEAAGNVAYLGSIVHELSGQDAAEQPAGTWGRSVTGYPKGSRLVGPQIDVDKDGGEHVTGELPRALVKMYGEWTDRLAKYAKMALDAGIEKRRVEMAERQGETIVIVIQNVFVKMGFDEAQTARARALVAEEFRALGDGS